MARRSESNGRGKSGGTAKLAESTARQVEKMLIERGWPVGTVLGSEADLKNQLGVSRAIFREAVRILEHHMVVRMRPGPGGGLLVVQPDGGAAARAMALYLAYSRVTPAQLLEMRIALESMAVEFAVARMTEEDIHRLRQYLDTELAQMEETSVRHGHHFHALIGQLAHNPVLELFVSCLIQLTEAEQPSEPDVHSEDARRTQEAHQKIAQAILDGDAAVARNRMQRHLQALEPWLSPLPSLTTKS